MFKREALMPARSFVLGGSDTNGITLAQILQHLAENPDAQERLRKEAADASGPDGKDISFEELARLPFLDAVVKETLRLCVAFPRSSNRVGRKCT